ncbi:MAG TPA: hypothetical protein VKG24_09585 [Pseudolabrys sp.]|nr:hypothetical protein [Pseudolabrys sp.]
MKQLLCGKPFDGTFAYSDQPALSMAKEKKSARELANMIAARMQVGAQLVSVHRDPAYGWAVNVFTGPAKQVFGDQVLAEQIAAELREKYDFDE